MRTISWTRSSSTRHSAGALVLAAIVGLVLVWLNHPARAGTGYTGPGYREIWGLVSSLVKDRKNIGKLDEKGLATVLSAVDTENKLEAVAVAYALAFSDSPKAAEILAKLQNHPNFPAARDTARFSVVLKATLSLRQEERLAILSYRLGRAETDLERTFFVNWIGSEYGKDAVPLFLCSIETTPFPPQDAKSDAGYSRFEMFVQILLHGDKGDAARAEKLLQKDLDAAERARFSWEMNEYLDTAFRLTESPTTCERSSMAVHLLRSLQEKAQN